MNKKIYFILILYFLCSCNYEGGKNQKVSTENIESTKKKLNNSIWVVDAIGQNGELQDTIVFKSSNSLIYIGHEPNKKELCTYTFNNDTLTFISHGTINDPNDFDKEILCEYSIKTLIKGEILRYLSVDMRNPVNNSVEHFDYRDNNLRFKRIKKNAL